MRMERPDSADASSDNTIELEAKEVKEVLGSIGSLENMHVLQASASLYTTARDVDFDLWLRCQGLAQSRTYRLVKSV